VSSKRIRIAHSPDSDDAFMFAGLALDKVETGELEVSHELIDIETLNKKAREGIYELTAISFHAYPYVCDRYALMEVGASFGDDYGPLLVAREALPSDQLGGLEVAVPGEWTTAHLALRLALPTAKIRFLPFDQILEAVVAGDVQSGLLIHEGQLTYGESGVEALLDLGVWWKKETGLPLPLGGNAIRRDLGAETMSQVARMLKASIDWGLANRAEALAYAQRFGRGLAPERVDRFVEMYVNSWTQGIGDVGKKAVAELMRRGRAAGHIPDAPLDWVSAD